MTAMYTVKSDNLDALLSTTGVAAAAAPTDTDGKTLAAGTYYVPLASSEGPTISECFLATVQFKWSAALAATITIESTNFPAFPGSANNGRADVNDIDAAAGNWIQENPASPTQFNQAGTGNTVTATTFVAGGTAASGVILYLPNAGARRYRLKVVVTVGGTLRVGSCGKD